MSGVDAYFPAQTQATHANLLHTIQGMGLKHENVQGRYGPTPQTSALIHNPTRQQMMDLGKRFGQESVIFSQNGKHELMYTNGPQTGKSHGVAPGHPPTELLATPPPEGGFSTLPTGHHFRLNFDFSKPPSAPLTKAVHDFPGHLPDRPLVPAPQGAPHSPRLKAALQAGKPVHATMLPNGMLEHLHPGLVHTVGAIMKKPVYLVHPAMAKAEPDILPDLGAELASQGEHIPSLLTPFGAAMGPGAATPSSYDLTNKLPEIHKLAQSYGFKSFLHGGRYGARAPEQDFRTGHLPIHDPGEMDPQQFNTENAKKTLIQLARALTQPEIDKLYGPAPSPESDVHWEDLASRKQRELASQLGINLTDDAFNREHNCAMANAVHDAVAGTLPPLEKIGFVPHSHEVPLSIALDLVRNSLPAAMAKAEPKVKIAWRHKNTGNVTESDLAYHDHKELAEPQENYDEGYTEKGKFHTREEYKKIHPRKMKVHKAEIPSGVHSTVEGFMQGLKALPKGSPARGKFITQHMNHPGFIGTLRMHPQGAQIHQMLTAHLNSKANAGPGQGVVTAKSETPVIFSSQQEKNVANPIDRQAALERIKSLTARIEDLRKREVAKALIPPHKHNLGTTVSSGIEDVAPSHLNPQGKNDPLHGQTATRPMTTQKGELCKGCGKSECACVKKDELVDPKGKQSCNGVVTKMPASSTEVSAEGSGGQIKKGKSLSDIRKAAMDMSKGGPSHTVNPSREDEGPSDQAPDQSDPRMTHAFTPGTTDKHHPELCEHCDLPRSHKYHAAPVKKASIPLSKPPVSQAQRAAMGAAASGNSTLGIPKSVGKDFIEADKGGKLPVKKAEDDTSYGEHRGLKIKTLGSYNTPYFYAESSHKKLGRANHRQTIKQLKNHIDRVLGPEAKKAEPPMAKPPSGVNMATKTPVSKPGNTMKPAAGGSLPKPTVAPKMPPLGKGIMSDIVHREAQSMGAPAAAPAPKAKLPSPQEQEDRASMFAGAMAGDYKPPAPVKPIHRTTTTVSVQPARPGIFARLNNPK
jgi:hypothetical protein